MRRMATMLDMRVCELLMARLCHDFAGPIAAIGNGAELLDDEDPEFVRQAAALIGDSAATAAKRLQLFRFIYGFSVGAIAGPPPHVLVSEYFAGGSVTCDYPDPVRQLGSEWQRLAGSLALVGAEALPRGGSLQLSADGGTIALHGKGEGDGPSAEANGALTLDAAVEALTSRSISAYFAGLLAKSLGYRLRVAASSGGFTIVCEPSGPG
jgi:histidine phosphotransferase ChpT